MKFDNLSITIEVLDGDVKVSFYDARDLHDVREVCLEEIPDTYVLCLMDQAMMQIQKDLKYIQFRKSLRQ